MPSLPLSAGLHLFVPHPGRQLSDVRKALIAQRADMLWHGSLDRANEWPARYWVEQVSNGNKGLARLVLGHAEEDVTDRYAKDKARLLAPAVLEAWQKIPGEWYEGEPVR